MPPNRTHQLHRSFTSSTCFNVSHLYPNIPLIYICFVLNTYLRGPSREAIHLLLNRQQGSLFLQHPIPTLHPIHRKLRCRSVHQHPITTLISIHRKLRCRRVHQRLRGSTNAQVTNAQSQRILLVSFVHLYPFLYTYKDTNAQVTNAQSQRILLVSFVPTPKLLTPNRNAFYWSHLYTSTHFRTLTRINNNTQFTITPTPCYNHQPSLPQHLMAEGTAKLSIILPVPRKKYSEEERAAFSIQFSELLSLGIISLVQQPPQQPTTPSE